MTKFLVLGIDGADFDILNPLFDAGRMPNLQGLVENGVRGPLRSTVPPSTCPGWQSFYTGKDPGNIGIFGFRNFEAGSYDVHVPDSSDLREATYWELLGDEEVRTGVVGGPFTYPPQAINGFMVSGPWTPKDAAVFTDPPELSEELREVCDGDYVFIPEHYEEAEFKEAFDRRTEVTTHLMETKDWDLFTVVYRPDPLQHVYWDKDDEVVFSVYEYLDGCLGTVLETVEGLDEEVNVMVMSDHGFEGVRRRYFHVNQWLENEGYLSTASSASSALIKYLPLDLGLNIAARLGVLNFIKRHLVPYEVEEAISNPFHMIDWERTEAFFVWEQQTGQIYVNVEGRFPQGIVPEEERDEVAREIRSSIASVTDEDGQPVVEETWLGSDLYAGTYRDLAPDVILTLDRAFKGQGTFGPLLSTLERDRAEGGHHIDGILFATGRAFGEGSIEDVEIIDLAPTLLHAMGAPVEASMDGKVRFDLFAPDSEPTERTVESVERSGGERVNADWSEDQRGEVEGRLEDLGYL